MPTSFQSFSRTTSTRRIAAALLLFLLGSLPLLSPLPLLAAVHPRAIGTQPPQFQQPTLIPTGSWPASIESADLNGDGHPDLVYTDYGATATSATTHILLNNGDGSFIAGQSIPTAGASVVVADFDRDGHPDLEWVASSLGLGQVFFARGNGDGTFATPTMLGTFAQIGTNVPQLTYLAAAQMHPSGNYLDLLVEDTANSALFELTADSSGTLVRLYAIHLPHTAGPMFTADLNGDGNTDLIIQSSVIDVFFGSPDGLLTPSASYTGPSGVRSMLLQDVDSDGHPDILLEGATGHLDLLHGNPDGTFSTASSGGTGSLDPATGAGGHLIGLTATHNLYTSTPAGISLLDLQSNLFLTLQGLYNAGPSPAQSQSSYALADFNNDGIPDLAIDSPEGIAILLANPDGTLQTSLSFSSNRPALSATLGDFTTDGSLDALLTLSPSQPQLMHGNSDGTFTLPSTTAPAPSPGPAASGPTLTADLNNDGILDLILPTASGLLLELGHGDGTFAAPSPITASRSNAIATNISAHAAIATSDASGDHILTAPALTRTTLATSAAPGLVAAGDLNHDGANDLLYQNAATWTIYLNHAGTFTPVSTLPGIPMQPNLNPAAALITDLDGDGNGDILILFDNTSTDHAHPTASTPNQLLIWYGNGDGTFSTPIALPLARNYTQLAAADTQNSGRPDLVLSDGYLVAILSNLGTRAFSPEQHFLAGAFISSISAADINHDGTNDLVLSNGATTAASDVATGGITVLLNHLVPRTALISTTTNLILTTPTTITYGQVVDGYAQVQSADSSNPSGTITFYDGATSICNIPVTASISCPASAGQGFAAGNHILTATYSGDSTHAASTSAPTTVIVQPAATLATLATSSNPSPSGQSVTLTATLSSPYVIPAGPVTFYDSGSLLGTGTLDASGNATLTTSSLAIGTHYINAYYAATPNFNASASSPLNQTITTPPVAASAVMISSSANPSTTGQTITLTANVVPVAASKNIPTGSVTILDGSNTLGTVALNASGLATLTTSNLTAGAHVITANYTGDANFASSASQPFTQTVNAPAPPSASSFVINPATTSLTLATGNTSNILVKISPINGFNQPVSLTCANLPEAATCEFASTTIPAGGATTTLKLTTSAPAACGSSTSYAQSSTSQTASLSNTSGLPYTAPALAGMLFLFLPKRRRALRSLLALIVMCTAFLPLTGCGACTNLGTRPGSYTFIITGTSTGSSPITVTRIIKLSVTE